MILSCVSIICLILRCARKGYLGLYTDVHHYIGWLTEILKDAETCLPPSGAKEDITPAPTMAISTTPELSENDAVTEDTMKTIEAEAEETLEFMESDS